MAMEARLSLRQSQRVVMTPLLQQAIQLLQLSTLELQEVVQKELLENPLLEEVPTETPETPEATAPGETPAPTAPTTAETQPLEPPPVDRERGTDDRPFDPGVPAHPAQERSEPRPGLGGDRRAILRRPHQAPLPGHRPRAQALPRPRHGVGRGDHEPRAQAGSPLRWQRLALHRARRGRTQDGQRVCGRAERGRYSAAPGQLALPLALAQLGRRGPGVRRAEASLGRLADQERGSAPAHAPQGDPVDREVPARVPGQGPALSASAVPPRRG